MCSLRAAAAAKRPPSTLPQVPIDSTQKLSPEWRAIHDLLRNDTSREALLKGATVTQLLRESSGNLTHYIGALQVEQSPGEGPRLWLVLGKFPRRAA